MNEQGSTWVADITDPTTGAHVYVATITGVEVVSAFARKLRGKLVTPLDTAAAISRFHHDFANEYRMVGISDAVITRSMVMAVKHIPSGDTMPGNARP